MKVQQHGKNSQTRPGTNGRITFAQSFSEHTPPLLQSRAQHYYRRRPDVLEERSLQQMGTPVVRNVGAGGERKSPLLHHSNRHYVSCRDRINGGMSDSISDGVAIEGTGHRMVLSPVRPRVKIQPSPPSRSPYHHPTPLTHHVPSKKKQKKRDWRM